MCHWAILTSNSMKLKNLLNLLFLATLWGPSFLFIKIAVVEIPPITLAALRIGVAAILINIYLFITGNRLPWNFKFWRDVAFVGLFAHTIPFILINWGQQYIDSALASILNAITPLSTIGLAAIFVKEDKMTFNKLAGSMIGLLGLLILISPNFSLSFEASFLGLLAVSIGASAYGVALVYARLNLTSVKSIQAPSGQLLITSLYMIPLALVVDGVPSISNISMEVIWSILGLASMGTAVAFVIYYKLLESAGPTFVSLVTYLMPIYGVVLGFVFLNEIITGEAIAGGIIILLGVMVVNKTIDPSKVSDWFRLRIRATKISRAKQIARSNR